MTDQSDRPPMERAERYRELAGKARLEAANGKGDAEQTLLRMAESWERLARTVETFAARAIQHAEDVTLPGTDEKLAALKPPAPEPEDRS